MAGARQHFVFNIRDGRISNGRVHPLAVLQYLAVDVDTDAIAAQVAAEDPWLRSNRNLRQLAGVAAPTLAAAGRQDPVVPPVNLRRIADRIPGARPAIFPGAHAFLFQERTDFARAVGELTGTPTG